ncbi:hypothetical protein [Nocardioides sp. GY 10127]|uniref:hypothetical protein n=1 Tax=Nocardioides sp. GY 10127 TaxID=2569762 RepID=UPI0014588979|nr:hypothetical protein [Nocardioides sp. GY 10127]
MSTTADAHTSAHAPSARTAPAKEDVRLDRITGRRQVLRTRHSARLTQLMEEREDLRGVHALADFVDDSVRWGA